MSDPIKPLTDTDRDDLLVGWLKPVKPIKPPRETMMDRIAPWRHQFIKGIALGYSWTQLAKEVARKPEIGVTTTGMYLKSCVRDAFVAAKEPVPDAAKNTPRRRKKKRAQNATSLEKSAKA